MPLLKPATSPLSVAFLRFGTSVIPSRGVAASQLPAVAAATVPVRRCGVTDAGCCGSGNPNKFDVAASLCVCCRGADLGGAVPRTVLQYWGIKKQRVVDVATDARLATAALRGGQVLEARTRTSLPATLSSSASADPQGSEHRDGLGSSVVSPCYAVSGGFKEVSSYLISLCPLISFGCKPSNLCSSRRTRTVWNPQAWTPRFTVPKRGRFRIRTSIPESARRDTGSTPDNASKCNHRTTRVLVGREREGIHGCRRLDSRNPTVDASG